MKFLDDIEGGVHPSWMPFFSPEIKELLNSIENSILANGKPFTPQCPFVLRFLSLDLTAIKVLILGQDPYPQLNRATGRSFEVGGLKSWMEPFENASLRNIIRTIYKAYSGDIRLFTEIRGLMENSLFETTFELAPPDKLFKSWESQGVLLLNSSFTCSIDEPGSQSALWHPFTQKLLSYINEQNPNIIWFIWGAHAQKVVSQLKLDNQIVTAHPMLATNKPNDMLFGSQNPFEMTMGIVNWRGV